MNKPITFWLLVASLIFLAFGGLYGGISMLADPSGKILQMDEVLASLPVPNYILPGLFLLFIMGFTPLFLTFCLFKRPKWTWIESIFNWSREYWALTSSLMLGIVLLIWLSVQAMMIGFKWPIQFITTANGILIVAFALSPKLRALYSR